jgi:hypothetical protein
MRAVDIVSMTARIDGETYTADDFTKLIEVAQGVNVEINARLKSTVVTNEAIEVLAELDPATIRWQVKDLRTGEQGTWNYGLTRLRLPSPPFDLQVIVEGSVMVIETSEGIFKPYSARLWHLDVAGVAEADFLVKAVHPAAIELALQLNNINVSADPEAQYINLLKMHVEQNLVEGKIGQAQSLMDALYDLIPMTKAVSAATATKKAWVTGLTVAVVVLAVIAFAGWGLWLIGTRRSPRSLKGGTHINDTLTRLWH